jgi:hypothetical protein
MRKGALRACRIAKWGFPGKNEAWEGPREERGSSAGESTGGKGLAGASEAWEGLQESRESSIALVNGPQEQYCFSCNRKKPLIDFGQFFTCNTYRKRNKKANRVWHAKQKAKYLNKSF